MKQLNQQSQLSKRRRTVWLVMVVVPSGLILGIHQASATWVSEVQSVLNTVGVYDPASGELINDLQAYLNDFSAFYSEITSGDVLGAFNTILGALGLPEVSSTAQIATDTLDDPQTPEQVYEVGQRGDTAIPTQVQGYAYALLDEQGQASAAQMQQMGAEAQQMAATAEQAVAQTAAEAATTVESTGSLVDLAGAAAQQALSRQSTQDAVKDLSQITAYAAGIEALNNGQLAHITTQNAALSTQLSAINAQQNLSNQQLINLSVGQAYQVLALNTLNSSLQQQLQYETAEKQRLARDAFVSGSFLYIPGLAQP